MAKVEFKLEKREDDNGQMVDTLIRQENGTEEIWTTIPDLNRLFDVCSRRWERHGWDLEKLITCINECEFD
ncbi:MAG: hypothetical protein ACXVB1_00130 [Pseudobdellovibrionaceae bacterium]